MSLRHRLIKGTALNLIAVAFNQGSSLVANILVARILMQQSFGEYSMVQTTLLTMAALSQLATGYTAAKYIAEYRSVDPARAGRIMGVCAIVSGVMAGVGTLLLVVMAPWLAGTMLNAPHLASALVIGAGFLLFSSINGYQTGALSGLEAYASLAKAGVASGIVAIVAISLGAWWGGLNGTLLGLSVSAIFRCGIHYIFLRIESRAHGIKPQYGGSLRQEKAIIWEFALPAAMAGYYSLPMIWFTNTILVRQPGGYSEMALYAAAINIKTIALFATTVINSVISSVLNHMKAGEAPSRYNRLYSLNILFTFVLVSIIALFLGLFWKNTLNIFGKGFLEAKLILIVLLGSAIVEATAGAIHQYIQNRAKMWLSFFYVNVPAILILVVSGLFIIPTLGGLGLAISVVCMAATNLLATVIVAYYIRERSTSKVVK